MIKNSIQGPDLFKEALNSITMDANSYISLHIILDKFAIFYSETIPPPKKKVSMIPCGEGARLIKQ